MICGIYLQILESSKDLVSSPSHIRSNPNYIGEVMGCFFSSKFVVWYDSPLIKFYT